MTELADYQIKALALQFCGYDHTGMMTGAQRREAQEVSRLMELYFLRTNIGERTTQEQQAEALGVSVATIQRMIRSDLYNQICLFMAPPKLNPIVAQAEEYLRNELLPRALRVALELLEDPTTPAGARVALIKEVMRAGTSRADDEAGDAARRHAMDFLRDQGVNIETVNILTNSDWVPTDYRPHLAEVIEGEVSDVDGDE